MMTKNVYKIAKEQINDFLQLLASEYELYAPTRDDVTRFSRVEDVRDVVILPHRTEVSVKSLIFPPEEVLFTWRRGREGYLIEDSLKSGNRKAFFGMRGCDIRALRVLDRYMLGEFEDPYYRARREAMIVGITCEYPRSSCFCTAFGGMKPENFDLWLTDIGEHYLVEAGSDEGLRLLSADIFSPAGREDVEMAFRKIRTVEDEISRKSRINLCETKKCSQSIKRRNEDPIWRELGKICLACGKCNFICPTCHCFDVVDVVNLSGNVGERVRVWDSCHLYEYAKTSAENFREERHARVRYRIYDKFVFPVMRYGMYACTGCGRCTDVCPAGIDIREVLRRLIS